MRTEGRPGLEQGCHFLLSFWPRVTMHVRLERASPWKASIRPCIVSEFGVYVCPGWLLWPSGLQLAIAAARSTRPCMSRTKQSKTVPGHSGPKNEDYSTSVVTTCGGTKTCFCFSRLWSPKLSFVMDMQLSQMRMLTVYSDILNR